MLGTSEGYDVGTYGRELCMSPSIPTSANHKKGDVCFNTNAVAGGSEGWIDLADGAHFAPLGRVQK